MAAKDFVIRTWRGPGDMLAKETYIVVDTSTGEPGHQTIECGFDTEGEAKIYLQERQRGRIHADAQRTAWDSVKRK